MGVHHLTCRATASGIDNLSAIANAIAWLCGDIDLVNIDKTTSYHGSEINIITVKVAKNSDIKSVVEKLKLGNLSKLKVNLKQRIDENNTLHFRLCLNSIINEKIIVVDAEEKSVKFSIKIEAYPGQNPMDNISSILGLQ